MTDCHEKNDRKKMTKNKNKPVLIKEGARKVDNYL